MSTKVVPLAQGVRIVSGKLTPYVEIDWGKYSMDELVVLLEEVMRVEVEHNYTRHKDYKDKKGANIEVYKGINHIKVSSVGDELIYIQDSVHVFDQLNEEEQ